MGENDIHMVVRSLFTHSLRGAAPRARCRRPRAAFLLVPGSALGLHVPAFLLFVLALLTIPVHSAVLGEIWSGNPDLKAIGATMGDLNGDGHLELVIAASDRLELYIWEPDAQRFSRQMSVGGFPAPISAITTSVAADREGHDLWVGMQGSGSIQRFSLGEHGLVGYGTVARLWTSVAELHAVDIDADGRTDLLALGQDGVAVLLRNGEDGFTQVWRTAVGDGPDRRVAVGSYAPGPYPTLVFGKEQGQVAIYRWRPAADGAGQGGVLERLAENYPWGIISAVDLVPRADGQSADLYIATTQSLLYKYAWDGSTSRHITQWSQTAANTATQLQALRMPDLATPLWVGLHSDVLTVWQLGQSGLREIWRLPDEELAWITQTGTGHLITYAKDGTLRVIGAVPASYLRVERDGVGYTLRHEPLFLDGQLFLSAQDLTDILPVRAWTSRNGTRLTGVASWFQFFIVDADSATISINGRQRPLAAPARMEGDVLYVPVDFATQLGFGYELIEPIRSLTFY